jgi:hypothetical protein
MFSKKEDVINKPSGSKVAGSKNDKLRIPGSPTQLWTHISDCATAHKVASEFHPNCKEFVIPVVLSRNK